MEVLGAFLIGYLLGGIPFGYLVVRWRLGRDIREMGSGNIGATNVARVMGKAWGRLVLALDMAKGLIAVVGSGVLLSREPLVLVVGGLGAIVGHMFPLYIGFKGGKGVATGIGVIVALGLFFPKLLLILTIGLLGWLLVYKTTGYVSAGSLTLAGVLLVGAWLTEIEPVLRLFLSALAIMVIYRHRDNIVRLIRGKEHHTEL